MERIPELANHARQVLSEQGYRNVHVHLGDGTVGLAEQAPYGAISVAAGAESLPMAYLDQLTSAGRIVIPLGSRPRSQTMHRFSRREGQLVVEDLGGFAFVPLVGKYGWEEGA